MKNRLTSKHQKGFGILEVLLILVIIGLLGGLGWYVWSNRAKESQPIAATPAAQTAKETEEPEVETEDDGYLTVKEWGVKFQLDDSIKDAGYFLKKPTDNFIFLTTPKLEELSSSTPNCKLAAESVSITRAKVGDDRFGSPWTQADLEEIGTKVGDYYYFDEGGQVCFGTDEDIAKIEKTVAEIGEIRANLIIAKTVMKS